MQTHLLQRYAPNSLHLLFHPKDTGNPNFDFTNHLQQFANRRINSDSAVQSVREKLRLQPNYSGNLTRIDLESIQVIGGRVLGRVEIDLGSADGDEQNYKILTVPYAEKQLADNNDDAVEFVRVIKAAVSAGVEADPRSLQIWASYGYDEIRRRYAEVLRNNPGIAKRASTSPTDAEALAEFKNTIIQDVLTELNRLAMELTATTATKEDRLLDEPETYEVFSTHQEQLTAEEKQNLFDLRYSELFYHHESGNPFTAELRAICSKLSPAHASGIVHDQEAQFQSYMNDMADSGLGDEGLEALQQSHERVTEQYSEGGVVSLHMSDSERFVVEGTLEEDVTIEYLPYEARDIALAIREQFLQGVKLFSSNPDEDTIDSYIETALNRLYGNPADKQARVNRTVRRVTTVKGQRSLVEYTLTKSVYPNGEEREYCREILDILIEAMQRDFVFRNINRSKPFRTFYNAIENAPDVRSVIEAIQRAYQAREQRTINVKMFTTLSTMYRVKRARLESTAIRVTKQIDGRIRTFIPATWVVELAKRIPTKDLRKLASAMHTLPDQERERISRLIRAHRSDLYYAILNGLLDRVEDASQAKRMYFRFAFYQDRKTGRPNEPHNMIHLLTQADTAAVWERLIELSGVAEPAAA